MNIFFRLIIMSFFCINLSGATAFAKFPLGRIIKIIHSTSNEFYFNFGKIISVTGDSSSGYDALVAWFDRKLDTYEMNTVVIHIKNSVDANSSDLTFLNGYMGLTGVDENNKQYPPIPTNIEQTISIFDEIQKSNQLNGEAAEVLDHLIEISNQFSNEPLDFESKVSEREYWTNYFKTIKSKFERESKIEKLSISDDRLSELCEVEQLIKPSTEVNEPGDIDQLPIACEGLTQVNDNIFQHYFFKTLPESGVMRPL